LELNDNKLNIQISEAKQGKQSAFNYLLDKYWREVYAYQLKRTQNEIDAEEITIQTFSKAFHKITLFNDDYKFSTWLITISKNIHFDILRKKKTSIQLNNSNKDSYIIPDIIDDSPTAEDKIIIEQNLEKLLLYIKKLKPHYQEVIQLRYFQEMSYKEISKEIDEPMTNVKVRLLRARKLLAEIIQKKK
jgi:RNA polymerase sigma factor (sigma-70 family)